VSLLQRNATLTRVQGASGGESYDGPTEGPEKWAGAADAYLRERRDYQASSAGAERRMLRQLVVETGLGIDWRSGDRITFTGPAGEEAGTVELVEARSVDDPDIPPEVQTTRLTLAAS
jgi:hypothetical protein